ncbi:unnamed protein product [Didymodactylos carnosus]|uniref:Uncharacterized protein n=1 Tax=Didymodactylos carnosus TaxID=1234261 RepID=A0A814AMK6_9BILA|nr:unnamed protein product [Didymodactylos carnosus]CAF3696421.1 unnamed protein product [Didymodactylos carnosus]
MGSKVSNQSQHDMLNDGDNASSAPSTALLNNNASTTGDTTTEVPINNDVVLIWFDENMASDASDTKTKFSKITDHVQFYTSQEKFLEYISSIENRSKTVFLIVAGKSTKDILTKIHSSKHIHSVYIYCFRCDRYQPLMVEFNKIKGIFDDAHDLILILKSDIEQIAHLTVFNFYNTAKQKSTRDLNIESAEFIWFQLLQEMLLKLPYHTEQAKHEFLTLCRNYYRGINEEEMINIDQFEREYKSENAINEYTKDYFLFRIINQALRTEDVAQLYALRYYIVDLCLNLIEQSKKYKQSNIATQSTIQVFRGLKLTIDEVDKLKKILEDGGLIAANTFLSTSYCPKVAQLFANAKCGRRPASSIVRAVFEIIVDLKLEVVVADMELFENNVFNLLGTSESPLIY